MSFIQCDQCKKILQDPVTISCGSIICKGCIKSLCNFCNQVHQDPFKENKELGELIAKLNQVKEEIKHKAKVFENLNKIVNDYVNKSFNELKASVNEERNRLIKMINNKSKELLQQIDDNCNNFRLEASQNVANHSQNEEVEQQAQTTRLDQFKKSHRVDQYNVPVMLLTPSNTTNVRLLKTVKAHNDSVYCVCFDRTGQFIFTVSCMYTKKKEYTLRNSKFLKGC